MFDCLPQAMSWWCSTPQISNLQAPSFPPQLLKHPWTLCRCAQLHLPGRLGDVPFHAQVVGHACPRQHCILKPWIRCCPWFQRIPHCQWGLSGMTMLSMRSTQALPLDTLWGGMIGHGITKNCSYSKLGKPGWPALVPTEACWTTSWWLPRVIPLSVAMAMSMTAGWTYSKKPKP